MMEHLRRLIYGKQKDVHPAVLAEVKPAELPPHLQEQTEEREKLSLRLMSEALQTASLSIQIRKALGREVAIKLQRRA